MLSRAHYRPATFTQVSVWTLLTLTDCELNDSDQSSIWCVRYAESIIPQDADAVDTVRIGPWTLTFWAHGPVDPRALTRTESIPCSTPPPPSSSPPIVAGFEFDPQYRNRWKRHNFRNVLVYDFRWYRNVVVGSSPDDLKYPMDGRSAVGNKTKVFGWLIPRYALEDSSFKFWCWNIFYFLKFYFGWNLSRFFSEWIATKCGKNKYIYRLDDLLCAQRLIVSRPASISISFLAFSVFPILAIVWCKCRPRVLNLWKVENEAILQRTCWKFYSKRFLRWILATLMFKSSREGVRSRS